MSHLTARTRTPRARPHRQLQELRINAGLSPNQLAYRAGVSGNTVRCVEAGAIPRPHIQAAIARVFGLSATELWPLEHQRALR